MALSAPPPPSLAGPRCTPQASMVLGCLNRVGVPLLVRAGRSGLEGASSLGLDALGAGTGGPSSSSAAKGLVWRWMQRGGRTEQSIGVSGRARGRAVGAGSPRGRCVRTLRSCSPIGARPTPRSARRRAPRPRQARLRYAPWLPPPPPGARWWQSRRRGPLWQVRWVLGPGTPGSLACHQSLSTK